MAPLYGFFTLSCRFFTVPPPPFGDNLTRMTSRTILIIDDDRELCDLVGELLARRRFRRRRPSLGAGAVELAASGGYALVILDVMLPEQNSFEILRALRKRCSPVPVILLTARGEDVDRSSASRSAPTTICPSRSTRAS